jgi:hypothetical protein
MIERSLFAQRRGATVETSSAKAAAELLACGKSHDSEERLHFAAATT